MPDAHSIRDLPDSTKIQEGKAYLVPGSWLITIFDTLKQLWRGENVGKGPNIRLRQNGLGGFTISGATQSADTFANQVYTPFQIFCAKHMVSGAWDNTYDVTLYPGTLNSLIPSNIFNTINMSITDSQYVILTGMSDGYSITSSTWSLTDTQPTPPTAVADTPPTSFAITLGMLSFNMDSSITTYQFVKNDLNAIPVEWLRTTRVGAGPYELAYVIYYTWGITHE